MRGISKGSARLLLACLLAMLAAASGCGKRERPEDGLSIFYLNKENTKIVARPYELESDEKDASAVIEELLAQLAADSGDVEFQKPVPGDVKVLDCVLEENLLTLYFSGEYGSMEKIREALARAAIVRTMTQAPGVECLAFYVGDAPLADAKGVPVGVMTNDSFVENPGEQINSIETAELTLYFANKEGERLVSETRTVHYSSNISMEKLVMEHLLEGPRGQAGQAAIPEGTKLMNVSVLDGACYVSLDESFRKQNYNIDEAVVIYSIVNSLSELPTINKVQISVNGDTGSAYREKFLLDTLYERNLDYVEE